MTCHSTDSKRTKRQTYCKICIVFIAMCGIFPPLRWHIFIAELQPALTIVTFLRWIDTQRGRFLLRILNVVICYYFPNSFSVRNLWFAPSTVNPLTTHLTSLCESNFQHLNNHFYLSYFTQRKNGIRKRNSISFFIIKHTEYAYSVNFIIVFFHCLQPSTYIFSESVPFSISCFLFMHWKWHGCI